MLVTSWRQSFTMQLHRHVPYLCSTALSQQQPRPEACVEAAHLGRGPAFAPRLTCHS